ncbi:UdgX family uracil-DNA binding protein [Bdellovibrio sp. BCCA]|uniref:UdgX family uracil-DNA binding protein n=1 Tax=Bdellovibrio sp. BCCA TaxID=3136281 RepID=UPI0030F1CB83
MQNYLIKQNENENENENEKEKRKHAMPIIKKETKKEALVKLEKAASDCQNCDLYKNATQVVFGKGAVTAKIMLVGEQPGHYEDLQGEPFVGPAGKILKACMEEAGLEDRMVYLTNAVKHFKHHVSGKKRLHDKPNYQQIKACRPWLQQQRDVLKPKIIVAMGATAARSVLDRIPTLGKERGKIIKELPSGELVILSWHPSAILRNYRSDQADKMKKELISDLKLAVKTLKELKKT